MGIERQEVNVLLVTDREIRKFNRRYLHHDRPTDVIAFGYCPLTPGPSPRSSERGERDTFGDIVISVDTARRQAKEMGHSVPRELQILGIHGLLHLIGYRDKKERDRERMWRKTEKLLSLLKGLQ